MRVIILITFSILLITSCKKRVDPWALDKSRIDGKVTATLNGAEWRNDIVTTNISSRDSSTFYMSIGVYENGIRRQELFLDAIDPHKVKQKVYPIAQMIDSNTWISRNILECKGAYHLSEYDVAEDSYLIADSADNYIYIDNYDPNDTRVKGTFQLTFYRMYISRGPASQNMPDTLKFTNGKFDVRIMQR